MLTAARHNINHNSTISINNNNNSNNNNNNNNNNYNKNGVEAVIASKWAKNWNVGFLVITLLQQLKKRGENFLPNPDKAECCSRSMASRRRRKKFKI
jgi:hypothetical protein